MRWIGASFFSVLVLTFSCPALAGVMVYSNGRWVDTEFNPVERTDIGVFGKWLEADSTLASAASSFLQRANLKLFSSNSRLKDQEWRPESLQVGKEWTSQKFNRTLLGLPVEGGEALVQLKDRQIFSATLDNIVPAQLPSEAKLSARDAEAVAYSSYSGKASSTSPAQLKYLVHGADNLTARLVFEVKVRDRDSISSANQYIDAVTGQELMVHSNVHTAMRRRILVGSGTEDDQNFDESMWYEAYDDSGCRGQQRSGDGRSSPCTRLDQDLERSARNAYRNAGLTHEYFSAVHGRNSIDGAGMVVKGVVNFFPNWENAAWVDDLKVMIYGIGGGKNGLNDFTSSIDVAGHEMTHGVVMSSARLRYESEPGALNESYADVFGKLIAFRNGTPKSDWTVGRELFPGGRRAIRDLANPEVAHTSQFKYRGQPCSQRNDFCGVHSNSGIPNRAAYLIAQKIGTEKLGRIYYATLTQLLRSMSSFSEAKSQSILACNNLFGGKSPECRAVADAFTSVGI